LKISFKQFVVQMVKSYFGKQGWERGCRCQSLSKYGIFLNVRSNFKSIHNYSTTQLHIWIMHICSKNTLHKN